MGDCIIVGAGALYDHRPVPAPGGLVIAADGGYGHLSALGLCADAVIGDFDSLPGRPHHPNVVELAKEKDDTDMLAAIKYGMARGCRTFHLYGGAGGRPDHTLANLQCLAYLARRGARGFLYGETTVAACIHDGEMRFGGGLAGLVSVFAHSDVARGVCLEGLKYALRDAELRSDFPLGVSNEFTGAPARISVRSGTILLLLPRGALSRG